MDLDQFAKLVKETRTIRRFREYGIISRQALVNLVELARNTPSSMNRQPLRYVIINNPEIRCEIFKCLRWAAALKDWDGPAPGERPAAYIIILGDKKMTGNFSVDPGIVAQTMVLGARTEGIGACILGSVDKNGVRRVLKLEERFEVLLAVALGKPAESVVIEPMQNNADFNYWRDENDVHHVPKRSLEELIIGDYT